MEKWKWWHIVVLTAEIAGLGFLVLSMTTDLNDDLFLPAALCCVCTGNVLSFIMNIRQRRKGRK